MKPARFDSGRFIQGVILLGFSVYLIKLFGTGDIHKLVAPHIADLLLVTLGLLLVMTYYALATIFTRDETCDHHHHDHHHDHDHRPRPRTVWALLCIPVVLGLTVPTQSLGASMMNSALLAKPPQHLQTTLPQKASADGTAAAPEAEQPVDLDTVLKAEVPEDQKPPRPTPGAELSLIEMWSNILITPEYYFNERYKFVGFVYHPPGWPTNRLILTRYMVSCCAADATPIGITVESDSAAKFADNTWIEVDGTVTMRKVADADEIPPISWYYGSENKPTLLGHSIKEVSEPANPYLTSGWGAPSGGE